MTVKLHIDVGDIIVRFNVRVYHTVKKHSGPVSFCGDKFLIWYRQIREGSAYGYQFAPIDIRL